MRVLIFREKNDLEQSSTRVCAIKVKAEMRNTYRLLGSTSHENVSRRLHRSFDKRCSSQFISMLARLINFSRLEIPPMRDDAQY